MFLDDGKNLFRILSVLELKWDSALRHANPRPFHALSFRLRGDATFVHDGTSSHVSADSIAYVPKDFEYSLDHKSEHLFVVHFEIEGDPGLNDFFSVSPDDTQLYHYLFRSLFDVWNRKRTGYRYAASSIFYAILEELQKELSGRPFQAHEDKMEKVIEYIHKHYCEHDISVSKLSEIYGTSETYFRRVFQQKCSTTPLKYVNRLRLKYAEELLHSGYYSVREVSEKVGFDDPKYFSRFFKAQKQIPPSKV
ncbi:MAG: hypothetical protein DBY45_05745 [Clostridiales bacterium]|nr:MAG: hypothetical protein DBY45_05745 [Clostridiales bacterium]